MEEKEYLFERLHPQTSSDRKLITEMCKIRSIFILKLQHVNRSYFTENDDKQTVPKAIVEEFGTT